MAAQDLDPRLFDGDDDAEDLAYKQILNGVIAQTTPPSQAATQIDKWVTSEAKMRFRQLKDRQLTQEEKDGLNLFGPNPSRHVDMIVGSIATVCSAYPPAHAAQNALVGFIEALKAIPKHQVPGLSYDNSHEPVLDETYSLWPFGTRSTQYLAQRFQREAEEFAYPFSEVETPGSEFQLRWRNLQAFIARLTTLDLIDCSAVSALSYILPSALTYPDLKERKKGGPQRIAADLVAASQWLAPDQARSWVYKQCKANAGEALWTMQNWGQWKEQLSFIAGDERFGDETRALARSLGDKMNALE
ncbi:hypothetical protein HRG_003621 [Hirsutella rhossiliensis]|uniref:Uncharacterized protein n=1 Tax=Hirsutella rhossiliensis TaxID=111463 RepID=A0A9P8N2D4_9HYPO|nr:uncharacterized protein HRG_03621 [Hirsutella rhossiliensis]KAH0965605.1 hypothetical protein HRG_03621 [Hirsutella rhossiliensis]